MFDIGFSELLVIGGVALIVLGPEKLPVVARAAGKWAGKAQRYVNDIKSDIAREGEMAELKKLKAEMEETGRSIEADFRTSASSVQSELTSLESQAKLDVDASAQIQASLDSTSVPYAATSENSILPAHMSASRYQASGFQSAGSALNTQDPIAIRMEIELLQDEIGRMESRLFAVRTGVSNLMGVLNSAPKHPEQASEQTTEQALQQAPQLTPQQTPQQTPHQAAQSQQLSTESLVQLDSEELTQAKLKAMVSA